jgi:L-asparagine oxygenase
MTHQAATRHATPPVIEATAWPAITAPSLAPDDPAFLRAAAHFGRLLPPTVHDALVDFMDDVPPAGAIVFRDVPVGALPATPVTPTTPTPKDRTSELVLLAVARRLGQPVGYRPELGGAIVQNIVPVPTSAARQTSTSSRVELMFHTEAAFHPHRPRYLVLLCLRGDPSAATTLASIHEVQHLLDDDVRRTLFEPRFRTAVDESYLGTRPTHLGPPMAVLSGTWDRPSMIFDADLMVGTDVEADDALHALSHAVAAHHTSVVLDAGDLLVVDNHVAVHGRSPFTPRFDGMDRWLQRSFVVADLSASAAERDGRIITTVFEA